MPCGFHHPAPDAVSAGRTASGTDTLEREGESFLLVRETRGFDVRRDTPP